MKVLCVQEDKYRTWENFRSGKNWRIVGSLPIFFSPVISF